MLKAVLLDIDNTLLDFDACTRAFLRGELGKAGRGWTEDAFAVFRRINGGFWRQIEKGELTVQDLRKVRWQSVFAELGVSIDGAEAEDRFRQALWNSAIPVAGADRLLRSLRGEYLLAIASNGPGDQQRNRLRLAGWSDRFERIFISGEFGASKPSAAFWDRCAAALAPIRRDEILMLGDNWETDVQGALGAGLRAGWFNYGREPKPEGAEPDLIAEHLQEIPALLRRL